MTWKTMQSKLPRLAAVMAAVVGLIALSASALAQPSTPHQFYGDGLSEGDVVGLGEDTATANAAGEWSIQSTGAAAAEVGEDSFTLNGAPAAAVLTEAGGTLTHVALTEAMMGEDDGEMMSEDGDGEMMGEDEDGEMMGEDGDEMMGEDGDEMMGEDEDHMLDEDDSMMGDDHDYPGTGSGGLADGGVSAGLIGLLIALGAVAVAGFGYRRIRNRA